MDQDTCPQQLALALSSTNPRIDGRVKRHGLPIMRPACIYALRDPDTRFVRYIGIAFDPTDRMRKHMTPSLLRANSHKNNWLKCLRAQGKRPIFTILAETDDARGPALEMAFIKKYRASGYRLTNSTKGGEGTWGMVHGPEVRAKQRAAKLGKPLSVEHRSAIGIGLQGNSNTRGTRIRPEVLENLRVARAGKPSPQLGKKQTEEARLHMSISRRNRPRKITPLLPAFGEHKMLRDWGDDARCVVNYDLLYMRVWQGMPVEQAMTMPKVPKEQRRNPMFRLPPVKLRSTTR